jgi:hypothetical protein
MYRIDNDGKRVLITQEPLQKAKRLTPTPDPTLAPTVPKRDRSTDMLGLVLLVLIAVLWFAAGYVVGNR